MQNAKLFIFFDKNVSILGLDKEKLQILPFIYIVSKIVKGNTKSLNFFKKISLFKKMNRDFKSYSVLL